jgi:DNA-binding CsgD family transcriptional regulator
VRTFRRCETCQVVCSGRRCAKHARSAGPTLEARARGRKAFVRSMRERTRGREIVVILATRQGRTSKEIGLNLGITLWTVNAYRRRLRASGSL